MTSITLGVWAYQTSKAESLADWARSHRPAPSVWKHALESRGYRMARDPKLLQKAARAIPDSLSEEATGWYSADLEAISIQRELYCRACDRIPEQWHPLEPGWQGFEELLGKFDAVPRKTPSPNDDKASKPWVDPLEIRY